MNIKDLVFYKKKGFLVKKDLIPKQLIIKINRKISYLIKKDVLLSNKNKKFEYLKVDKKNHIVRLKNPVTQDKIFYSLSRNNKIISIVSKLLGGTVRFHHSKLNFKLPSKKGGVVHWHQDWAFYPHTNDDLLAVGIYLEDCKEINGPLKVLPGSHRKELYDHHDGGSFVGKINHKKEKLNINKAISLIGQAGTVTFHHVRIIHGSGLNLTLNKRPLILFGYVAVDSWPLTYDSGSSEDPNSNLEIYNKLIIKGKPTLYPRIEKTPIKIPLPRNSDSIYDLQKEKKKN